MKRDRSVSLVKQLFVLLVTIVTIVMTTGYFTYAISARIIEKKVMDYNSQIMNQIDEKVLSFFDTTKDIMDSFSFNTTLLNFMEERDNYRKFLLRPNLDNLLHSYMKLNNSIFDIALFDPQGILLYSYSDNPYLELRPHIKTDKKRTVSGVFFLKKNYLYYITSTIYSPQSPGRKIGTCAFIFNTENFSNIIKSISSTHDFKYYILDSRSNIIVSSDASKTGRKLDEEYNAILQGHPDGHFRTRIGGREHIIQSQSIREANWKIFSLVPVDILLKDLTAAKLNSVLFWIAIAVLLALLFIVFIHNISFSVRKILTSMIRIEAGNLAVRIKSPFSFSTEFNVLGEGLNKMMDKIVELTDKNTQMQTQLFAEELNNKQTRLLALQSQINPHFLYNTLECINSMGVYYKSPEIQEMTKSLASIFRYAIKSANVVKVSEEIESIRCYLRIQQIRFFDKFEVQMNLDEQAMKHEILKFILQPIVENSIFHGIEPREEKGKLKISVALEEEIIKFEIADNGVGMDQAAVDMLADSLSARDRQLDFDDTQGRSIGLKNITNRIKLFYGDQYGLEICSGINEGTTVVLRIPKTIVKQGEIMK